MPNQNNNNKQVITIGSSLDKLWKVGGSVHQELNFKQHIKALGGMSFNLKLDMFLNKTSRPITGNDGLHSVNSFYGYSDNVADDKLSHVSVNRVDVDFDIAKEINYIDEMKLILFGTKWHGDYSGHDHMDLGVHNDVNNAMIAQRSVFDGNLNHEIGDGLLKISGTMDKIEYGMDLALPNLLDHSEVKDFGDYYRIYGAYAINEDMSAKIGYKNEDDQSHVNIGGHYSSLEIGEIDLGFNMWDRVNDTENEILLKYNNKMGNIDYGFTYKTETYDDDIATNEKDNTYLTASAKLEDNTHIVYSYTGVKKGTEPMTESSYVQLGVWANKDFLNQNHLEDEQ